MIRFIIPGDPDEVELPSYQAIVEYMNSTATYPSPTAQQYMLDYSKRSVVVRDIDIRATDYESFVLDLIKVGDIKLL